MAPLYLVSYQNYNDLKLLTFRRQVNILLAPTVLYNLLKKSPQELKKQWHSKTPHFVPLHSQFCYFLVPFPELKMGIKINQKYRNV